MLFNALEGLLWLIAAGVTWVRAPSRNAQERLAVWLGTISFVLFGLTDWLECQFGGRLPWWLWGLKIGCGIGLVAARYTWLGWHRFRLWNREVLFGLACLIAVALVIWLQGELEPGHPENGTANLTNRARISRQHQDKDWEPRRTRRARRSRRKELRPVQLSCCRGD